MFPILQVPKISLSISPQSHPVCRSLTPLLLCFLNFPFSRLLTFLSIFAQFILFSGHLLLGEKGGRKRERERWVTPSMPSPLDLLHRPCCISYPCLLNIQVFFNFLFHKLLSYLKLLFFKTFCSSKLDYLGSASTPIWILLSIFNKKNKGLHILLQKLSSLFLLYQNSWWQALVGI